MVTRNLDTTRYPTECWTTHNNNNMSVTIDGDSNTTHTEIGNGGDTNNTISVTIDNGDSNTLYTEVLNGSTNTIDVQVHDSNTNTVTVNGSNNDIKAWQGKHEDWIIAKQAIMMSAGL